MEFRVLGPIQVAGGAGPVELASGKQLALLACLLIARGEVVSRDRLIDALWGEQPPAAAVNSLQVHVHGLRGRLGPERIERDGPGYRLRLMPGELDLERFDRLVERGRSELERAEAETAAASLREALGLWRGHPYEDVRYEAFAQAEVARLEELRLAALEDRINADLALGRHRALVPELEALVSEHAAPRAVPRPADARPVSERPAVRGARRVRASAPTRCAKSSAWSRAPSCRSCSGRSSSMTRRSR